MSIPIRPAQRICADLAAFGVLLDSERNHAANGREGPYQRARTPKVEVWVIPLDEELQMARAASKLLQNALH